MKQQRPVVMHEYGRWHVVVNGQRRSTLWYAGKPKFLGKIDERRRIGRASSAKAGNKCKRDQVGLQHRRSGLGIGVGVSDRHRQLFGQRRLKFGFNSLRPRRAAVEYGGIPASFGVAIKLK